MKDQKAAEEYLYHLKILDAYRYNFFEQVYKDYSSERLEVYCEENLRLVSKDFERKLVIKSDHAEALVIQRLREHRAETHIPAFTKSPGLMSKN